MYRPVRPSTFQKTSRCEYHACAKILYTRLKMFVNWRICECCVDESVPSASREGKCLGDVRVLAAQSSVWQQ